MKVISLVFASFIFVSCSHLEGGRHTANSPTAPQVNPHIEYAQDACQRGAEKTQVVVLTEKENYNFEPSCASRFYESFLVENKLECIVESMMCTGFTGQGEMKVHCTNGESHQVGFECTGL